MPVHHVFLFLCFTGYGIEGDLQMLAKVIPQLKQSLQQMHRVVELQKLHHQVKHMVTGGTISNAA